MIRRIVALSLIVALFSSNASAAGADQASVYIDKLAGQALSAISNPKLSKDVKQKTLEKIFADNIDFAWVGKFVMGRFWKQATPEQQKNYLATYQNFLIANYTSRFTEYTSGSYKITGAKEAEEKGEYTVGMEILSDNKNEPPVVIDYKIRRGASGFKVFDIVVEGVSLINTQRSEFTAVLSKQGVEELIAMLASKASATSLKK